MLQRHTFIVIFDDNTQQRKKKLIHGKSITSRLYILHFNNNQSQIMLFSLKRQNCFSVFCCFLLGFCFCFCFVFWLKKFHLKNPPTRQTQVADTRCCMEYQEKSNYIKQMSDNLYHVMLYEVLWGIYRPETWNWQTVSHVVE